jgi:hypothetical protein
MGSCHPPAEQPHIVFVIMESPRSPQYPPRIAAQPTAEGYRQMQFCPVLHTLPNQSIAGNWTLPDLSDGKK